MSQTEVWGRSIHLPIKQPAPGKRGSCKSEPTWLVLFSITGQADQRLHKESLLLCYVDEDDEIPLSSCCRTYIDWTEKAPDSLHLLSSDFSQAISDPAYTDLACLFPVCRPWARPDSVQANSRSCLLDVPVVQVWRHPGQMRFVALKALCLKKIGYWNQLEMRLIAAGLEHYFQSSLKVEIVLAMLMTNISLQAEWCILISWTPSEHFVLGWGRVVLVKKVAESTE